MLTVFHAGSLRRALGSVVESFRRNNPDVGVVLEGSASLEAVRKLTHDRRIPDLLLVADQSILPRLVVPVYADWYVQFGRNRMGLLYSDRSAGAARLNPANWWSTLLTPGVRIGMSDPARDPAGYRTLLVLALAERHCGVPGLAAQLRAAISPAGIHSHASELVDAVRRGELDYAFEYESVANAEGVRFLPLPAEIDLSDPARRDLYAAVEVTVGEGTTAERYRGEPIVYGLTIPRAAANPIAAVAFTDFLLAEGGRSILARAGLTPIEPELRVGVGPTEPDPPS